MTEPRRRQRSELPDDTAVLPKVRGIGPAVLETMYGTDEVSRLRQERELATRNKRRLAESQLRVQQLKEAAFWLLIGPITIAGWSGAIWFAVDMWSKP